ncbi:MAG: transglycosylase domain-containing protein [Clostridia bacterium]|nr:transglycosylase domain-containing protein [Clostridia bacterium]
MERNSMNSRSSYNYQSRSNRNSKKKKKQLRTKRLRTSFSFILICAFAVLGIALAYILKIILTSPDINAQTVSPDGFSTIIYDDNGERIDELHDGSSNRVYKELDEIPEYMQQAVLVMEDKRFYQHNGIDFIGLARAIVIDVCTLSKKQGASTLTQQLIKNNVLTADKKIDRKIREMYLATVLESKLKAEYGKEKAKETILELYLNTVGFGKGCYGVQAAANRYFGKDINELTLDECTVLAAIIQSPTHLEPVSNPEANNDRRKIILKYMYKNDDITKEQYEASLEANPYVGVSEHNVTYVAQNTTNSYFVDALIEEVTKDLVEQKGLTEDAATHLIYSGGLNIYSTMDKHVQESIDSVFVDSQSEFATVGAEYQLVYNLDIEREDGTPKYFQKTANIASKDEALIAEKCAEMKAQLMTEKDKVLNESHYLILQPQAAMAVIDYHDGHVKGIAGGRGDKNINRGLNRATQSPRQAGSTFKVLAAFVPAIDMKIKTAASVQDDVPYYLVNYGNKEIKNWYYNPNYRGLSTLRDGTRDSMNIVAVKTIMDVGLDNSFEYLKKFGFTTLVESRLVDGKIFSDKSPSVALGGLTDGVTVLELTAAYGAIANGGVLNTPILYTKVTNSNDEVILEKTTTTSDVIDPGTAYIATTMMHDVITSGTGGSAGISGQYVAGKTGTTSDSKDLTFVGYTPYYVAGIWVGHDQPKVIRGDQSIHTKAWSRVMSKVHANLPYKDFVRPGNVTTALVCAESGKLAVEGMCDCDQRGSRAYTEYFLTGTVPTEYCDVHVRANAIKVDDKFYLANANDPGVENLVFIQRPNEATSYYDPAIKDQLGDSIYEVPTESYNGQNIIVDPDEENEFGDEGVPPTDDIFKTNDDDDDEEDFEPVA